MTSRWSWLVSLLGRQLWFRAALISLLAVLAPIVAILTGPYIPSGVSQKIGADSVGQILDILASSMLAVTTFSLTTMVSAYSAATTSVTPRATKLMIEDTTSQNVLAAFLGSFLFSLVGIITLAMNLQGENGRLVLFVFTLIVVMIIVVTLVRWIDYVVRLGRVNETTREVEEATEKALVAWIERPNLGGGSLPAEADRQVGHDHPVFIPAVGYVRHIDVAALAEWADARQATVSVAALPGTLVDPTRPVAYLTFAPDDDDVAAICEVFMLGKERSFDQDPRFGFSVLAEIASRALSPAINDPGTAIDVISRAIRLLTVWDKAQVSGTPAYPRLFVPALTTEELLDDVFTPIARDGAGIVEVQIRLQKAFGALARQQGGRCRTAAGRHSRMALGRAEHAMTFDPDRERVRKAAAEVLA
ncbi:DUF2254 domain-containing protein [Aquibium carbonis]|uniref:DUF2254 domain-containing protein n=1 Tax=Aquibium carbonis TaxID=2495581 RepID=A0A429YX63_9HYPH|nr:DUF2254 domain-containing protein [Aquibium carbonis]RST86064.1 DUF2254 domain-containing protein [Aquibium carbonis]